ncbi:hypothetical protein [Rothia uropygialis]|uniref:hypothetical protein n=1 Tax=Kocuria sp. 36 TaxID=1415402 RepID=UPI00101DA303|nr:hypothetical protein [Kocuria sp. 36]
MDHHEIELTALENMAGPLMTSNVSRGRSEGSAGCSRTIRLPDGHIDGDGIRIKQFSSVKVSPGSTVSGVT